MLTVSVDRNVISKKFKATVSVSSDVSVTAYEVRATKTGELYGRGRGLDLLSDDTSAVNGVVDISPPVRTFTFDIESDELSSDGEYRISVYVMNEDGIWNDCCQLFTSAQQQVVDSTGDYVLVKRLGNGNDDSYFSAYPGDVINNFISEVLS